MPPDTWLIGVSVPDGVPNEQERTEVVGVSLKALSEVGKSEYDGGGVTGTCEKAWDGAIVWGAIDSVGGIQCNMLPMDIELDMRSGWLKMGRDKHGLVADSGR